ncbi:phosphoglycerate mutase-like protein [Wallemia mellicola]|nr:phosphoglycerate mutase-like protein [Wallemia mellicola]
MPYVMASAFSGQESNVVVVAHGIFLAELQYALLKRRPQGWHRIVLKLATPTQSKLASDLPERRPTRNVTNDEDIEKQETLVEGPPSELNPATPMVEIEREVKYKKLDVGYINISESGHLVGLTRAKGIGSMAFDEKQPRITDLM